MDANAALGKLAADCASTVYPTLSQDELGALLIGVLRWTTWAPSTTYAHGDQVIPTVRNGHVYKAIVNQQYTATPAGVSDVTEPIWPLFSSPDSKVGITRPYWSGYDQMSGNYSLSMVTDGTLVWQDAGPDNVTAYDVRAATYSAWLQKAAKASGDFDFTTSVSKFTRAQVVANCMAMACRFAPTGVW